MLQGAYAGAGISADLLNNSDDVVNAHLNQGEVVRHSLKDTHEVMDAVLLFVSDEVGLSCVTTEDDASVLTDTSYD